MHWTEITLILLSPFALPTISEYEGVKKMLKFSENRQPVLILYPPWGVFKVSHLVPWSSPQPDVALETHSWGISGWLSGLVPAFGPGRGLGVLGSSPTLGSLQKACFSASLRVSHE